MLNAELNCGELPFTFYLQPSALCILEMAARVGLAPTPCGLTNRRATLTPPGNGAAGRTPTCMVPFRRRMPHVFGRGSTCTCVPSVPSRMRWLLRYALIGGPEGSCTLNPPADNVTLC